MSNFEANGKAIIIIFAKQEKQKNNNTERFEVNPMRSVRITAWILYRKMIFYRPFNAIICIRCCKKDGIPFPAEYVQEAECN